MRICAAQVESIRGDIDGNVRKHESFVELAASHAADLIYFPELSLMGYEPTLAKDLATDPDDERLQVFQRWADSRRITIGVGLPTRYRSGVRISMILFQSRKPPLSYAKQQLHSDELPFFVYGEGQLIITAGEHRLAPAICFESLQPNHADAAARQGADVHLASVAKPRRDVLKAYELYSAIAQRHAMTVLMANCVGPCDDFVSAGQSAIWNARGQRVAKVDGDDEAIVMCDTATAGGAVIHCQPPKNALERTQDE